MKLSKQFIGLAVLGCCGAVFAQTTLATCRLGKGQHEIVSVIAEQPIADSRLILLKTASDGRARLIFGSEDDVSRGAAIRVRCVGKEEKILILIGEFLGSGYPKGVAVRFNNGELEQLEFAEPGLPTFVDLTPFEMRLVFPKHAPEISAPLAIYVYVSGAGPTPDVKEAYRLPKLAGAIRIPVQP